MAKHAGEDLSALKESVRTFWDAASCGELYAEGDAFRERLEAHARARYALEPYIVDFARFSDGRDRDVLEIGVGMGADHLEWAKASPRTLSGIDLTPRGVEYTQARLGTAGYASDLRVGDAEALPYPDASFDLVYSWGVLHHSPETPRTIEEIYRVLRPGGRVRVMIYHKYSLVGYMLWLRYGLLTGRPTRSLGDLYAHHLESPGTKAYTVDEARAMFAAFKHVEARSELAFGDLLEGAVGQRYRGALLSTAKTLWPRWFFRRFMPRHGLMLLVEAVK